MSDGTLRALGLILATFQAPRPSVIVIEEPEATIHPGALGAILDLLHSASKMAQVVVTTHSPEVLDAEWIEDRHLRVVEWRNGATRVERVSKACRESIQEHLMGAGELLRSDALEAEPFFADLERLAHLQLFEEFPGTRARHALARPGYPMR